MTVLILILELGPFFSNNVFLLFFWSNGRFYFLRGRRTFMGAIIPHPAFWGTKGMYLIFSTTGITCSHRRTIP
jgi:hypothetical protein